MKRKLTLIGSIFATVGQGLLALTLMLGIIMMIDMQAVFTTELACGIVFAVLLTITSMLLSIFVIPSWKASEYVYRKSKPMIIVASVFNFVMAFILFNAVAYVPNGEAGMVLYLFAAFDVTGGILMLVDLGKKHAVETTTVEKTVEESVEDEVKPEEENPLDAFERKVAKIMEFKEKGILTEEEFNEMKKTYLDEYFK